VDFIEFEFKESVTLENLLLFLPFETIEDFVLHSTAIPCLHDPEFSSFQWFSPHLAADPAFFFVSADPFVLALSVLEVSLDALDAALESVSDFVFSPSFPPDLDA
jgi:hypothetical protein